MDTEAETEAPARSLNCVEAEAAAGAAADGCALMNFSYFSTRWQEREVKSMACGKGKRVWRAPGCG